MSFFVERSDVMGNLNLTYKVWQPLPQHCRCQSEAEARQELMAAPALSPECPGGNKAKRTVDRME